MMFLEELVIVVIIGKFSLSSPFVSTFLAVLRHTSNHPGVC